MVEVAILAGSASDAAVVERTAAVLKEHGVAYETRVISAHREPDILDECIRTSDCRVFIAIAGLSAALPGVVASKTSRPVIGVPVSGKLMGIDALLSIVQMPKGVPVACVGIDNGENAALLAIRILGVQ
ncbi:MAG: 5-(carboxyamino)imidazole ribonucleotide mutase [Methanomicrobiales archaeon]|nr:5-(carboxyamino)imidazole ribonucleotide mutase [Methanomicrobiales archaeon]NYT21822.1 5-(carboxyamino)imidazole ribonucleotide mutase [Methanomicrobiales archaeon]